MDKILILDFGSQYTQLIARRVRESKVYCEIWPYSAKTADISAYEPQGIILSGSPFSVYQEGAPLIGPEIFRLKIPVLGICYGMQLLGHLFEGEVIKSSRREYGRAQLMIDEPAQLLQDLDGKLIVWMSHGDKLLRLPAGYKVIAHTANSPIAAVKHQEKPIYGVQFHPEVVHTPQGKVILQNFLYAVCGCRPTWTMASFVEQSVKEIRERVGTHRVICALSGGVDSSVVAMLLHKALGPQLTCIFVDNGVLRQGEAVSVVKTFRDHFHINLDFVEAEERFLKKLAGVEEPEEKRRRIGHEFIAIFEEEARKVKGAKFLAQGTLYPDVIESVSVFGPSATIKSHHNVGGLPPDMELELIEPLRYLFKDEVRLLGKELGLPDEIVQRQPFPGPGLAIRVIGEVTKERLDTLREADFIVLEEIKKAGLYREIWQAFAVLLPVKSVGVMGDERTYENVVALRAVTSQDGMTADWAQLPYELLGHIADRIINEVRRVNRVVYDISSKPPSTIEWE